MLKRGLISLIVGVAATVGSGAIVYFLGMHGNVAQSSSGATVASSGEGKVEVAGNMPRLVSLTSANEQDLRNAFVFSRVVFFPHSNLIYVRRADAKRDGGELLDLSGKPVATVDYDAPDFSDSTDHLYPARRGSQIGFIDDSGAWKILPRFQNAYHFEDGVAFVTTSDGSGAIDTDGHWLLEPKKYKSVLPVAKDWIIAEGTWYVRGFTGSWSAEPRNYSALRRISNRAVAAEVEGKYILLGRSGEPVTAQRFDNLLYPHEGRVPASLGDKWGLIDDRGAWVIAPKFESLTFAQDGVLHGFLQGRELVVGPDGKIHPLPNVDIVGKPSEGLIAACDGQLCGYVDAAGKWIISARFEQVSDFSDGVARIVRNGIVAYIDVKGNYLTPEPPSYAPAPWQWRPGAIRESRGEIDAVYGYIGVDGEFAVPPVFTAASNFGDGRAAVQTINEMYGYIDKDGNWAIQPLFRRAESFSEGMAQVNGHRGTNSGMYIDVQGRRQFTLPAGTETGGPFVNGRASVTDYNGNVSSIDKTGKKLPDAGAANGGFAPPELQRLSVNGGKWGYADRQDNFIIAPQFDDAGEFADGYAPVKLGEKWGFVGRDGQIAIPPRYDEVRAFSEGYAAVKEGDFWNYVDTKGRSITTLAFSVAGDFHDGRARVGVDRQTAARHMPAPRKGAGPVLVGGSNMHHGIAFIELLGDQDNGRSWLALMNAKGQLIIP